MNIIQEYIQKFINRVDTLFQGDTISPTAWSMMRFLSWFVIIVTVLVWAVLCVLDHKMLDIPAGVIALDALAFGSKILQKKEEVKEIPKEN